MNISYFFRIYSLSKLREHLTAVAILFSAFHAHSTWASTSKLSPAKIKQIKRTNKSYKECQKTALQEFKSQKLTQPAFKSALDSCKERYPGAGLYIACKKKALADSKAAKSTDDASEDIAECKQYLTAAAFDPDASVPFFHDSGQLYFSGIGLNKSTTLKALNPPNFDCDRLVSAVKKPVEASYLLFGNHPTVFSGWENVLPADLTALLKLSAKSAQKEARSKAGYLIPGAGRIYGLVEDKGAGLFFPSAPCDFDGQTGNIFSGLSTYYLIEPEAQVTPYFGIAYFKASQRSVTMADLVSQVATRLGSDFKSFKKNSQVVFIASSAISETDGERDPRNLCRPPRRHQVLGVVQSLKDNPRQPEYLIVANIKNLCDYGDRLARRLAK